MGKVKTNSSIITSASTESDAVQAQIDNSLSNLGSFTSTLKSTVDSKVAELDAKIDGFNTEITELKKEIKSGSDGETEEAKASRLANNRRIDGEIQTLQGYINKINNCKTTISEKLTSISGITTNAESTINTIKTYTTIPTALTAVSEKVTAFDTTHGDVSFSDIVSSSSGITLGSISNVNAGNVDQLLFTFKGEDGKEIQLTLGELVNAFYTYQGASMETVVSGAVLMDSLGLSDKYDDDYRRQMLASTGSVINMASSMGLFKVATQGDIDQMYADLGVTKGSSVSSLLSDEDKTKYASLLEKLAGSDLSLNGSKVAASLLGAFALTAFINKNSQSDPFKSATPKDPETWTDPQDGISSPSESTDPADPDGDGNPDGGDGNPDGGGDGGDGGGSPTATTPTVPTDPFDTPTPSPTTITPTPTDIVPTITPTVPGTVEPIDGTTIELQTPTTPTDLPTEPVSVEIEKDYDDLARQQYEAQGAEKIAEHRAQVIEEANRLYDAEDKSELINKLREYGYSNEDIATILKDRDLTISAMVAGDERLELAKIAQELATADGLENFDTLYDNEQTLSSLTDGTVDNLLATVTLDENVAKAYTTYNEAVTAYTDATAKVNTALTAVTTAEAELNQVMEEIGATIKSEPSQWDKTTLDEYNTKVNELYESTKQSVGGNINNWSSEDLTTYQNAQTEAYNTVAYDKGKDYSKWSSEDKASYTKAVSDIETKYKNKYGKDPSKWSQEVVSKYQAAVDNEYKKKAIEIGGKNLTAEDNANITAMAEKTKQELILKNGDESKWTDAQKQEYQEKVDLLKKEYAEKASTVHGEAHWTDEQATKYNEAIEKYNKAVEEAKTAMAERDTAKATIDTAKIDLDKAKEDFFESAKRAREEVQVTGDVPVEEVVPEVSGQIDPESTFSIGEDGTVTIDDSVAPQSGDNIEDPIVSAEEVVSGEVPDVVSINDGSDVEVAEPVITDEIENVDEASVQDFGIPIEDASSVGNQ